MRWFWVGVVGTVLTAFVIGCSSTTKKCEPACGPCQSCNTSGENPVCQDNCTTGLKCQDNKCVAEEKASCSPACGDCEMCDTSGSKPLCKSVCSAGTTCDKGKCVAPKVAKCDPGCKPCEVCDTSGSAPICKSLCSDGMTCKNGTCEAPKAPQCDPGCKACQTCDTSGATPVCKDNCAAGLQCQDSKCVAPAVAKCDPGCKPCQMCDTSGAKPKCVDMCSEGLSCEKGACVAKNTDPCKEKCVSCQRCDTSHGVPYCVDNCKKGLFCDTNSSVCRPRSLSHFDHSKLPELKGPFAADNAGGKAVTAKCVQCHQQAGKDMLVSAHFLWKGLTPLLKGKETSNTVGKVNLINNFCVSVAANEKRCSQCHAGYGYADNNFDFKKVENIDCLVCHSNKYKKSIKNAGAPDATVDMAVAAQSVGMPTRENCGRCHFFAGGGDNVKKGDLGSAMTNPTAAADVHMGNAKGAFNCSTCHKGSAHKIPGQGVHLPVSEGRVGCTDCHSNKPHNNALLDNHALDVACTTCHIPAFSRQQPTKMDWDWSTAGNKNRGTNGVEMKMVDGKNVPVYDAKKGDFVWKANVQPTYAWHDGRVQRMTLTDSFAKGAGTKTNPINLGSPIASKADANAKIHPFKVMRGRQPIDPNTRLILAPKLFGPGGFWATIPAAKDYTAQKVEDNWTAALTAGALYAGQIKAGEKFTGRAKGAKPWDWGYTMLYLSINHEVAPKGKALGCKSCHGSSAKGWDWKALGYACDPSTDPVKCGSRNK